MDSSLDNATLSVKQKKIIQDTWKMYLGDTRMQSNLFIEFLLAYPLYISTFGIKKGEDFRENKTLKAHGENVKVILTYLIEHALDDPFLFESLIIVIGRNHVNKPINPIHFKNFTSVLLNALRLSLGKQMAPAIEQAWILFFEYINNVIREVLLCERGLPVQEDYFLLTTKRKS